MEDVLKLLESQGLGCRDFRERSLLVLEGCIRVVRTFDVDSDESREHDSDSSGGEDRLPAVIGLCVDQDCGVELLGVLHLGSECPLPDEGIQIELLARETCLFGCAEALACRSDGLVGFLGVCALCAVVSGLVGDEVGSVQCNGGLSGCISAFLAESRVVCSHVGDETVLIEALCNAHRFLGGHVELSVALLLQGAGRERGCGILQNLLLAHIGNRIGTALEGCEELFGILLGKEDDLASGRILSALAVEVLSVCDPEASDALQRCREAFPEGGSEIPVFRLLE